MIGETGWPSHGRQRQGAMPSLVNQARFIREFTVRAELEKVNYNLIEAFDQPWKRQLEGAAGGYWGLYNLQDRPKFPVRGPVPESSGRDLAVILAVAALFALYMRAWRDLRVAEALLLFATSIGAGSALFAAWQEMFLSNRSPVEWIMTGIYGLLLIPLILILGRTLAAWCVSETAPPAVAPLSALVRWVRRNDQSFDARARALGGLRAIFLFGAAFVCLLLFFDPRYRDFPLALYAVPAFGFALLSWISSTHSVDLEEILLAGLIGVLAVLIALSEHLVTPRDGPWSWAHWTNPHALAWSGLCLLLAGSVLVPIIGELRARQGQYA
jgi:glucan 1,3-beta-glucosidase